MNLFQWMKKQGKVVVLTLLVLSLCEVAFSKMEITTPTLKMNGLRKGHVLEMTTPTLKMTGKKGYWMAKEVTTYALEMTGTRGEIFKIPYEIVEKLGKIEAQEREEAAPRGRPGTPPGVADRTQRFTSKRITEM